MRIGVWGDIHYVPAGPDGSEEEKKLAESKLNAIGDYIKSCSEYDAVICLGDVIGEGSEDQCYWGLSQITRLYQRGTFVIHYVMGNRDATGLDKGMLIGIDKKGCSYYSFKLEDILFIALDACFTHDGKPYSRDNDDWMDAFIPEDELDWLSKQLERTDFTKAVVLCHHRLDWFLDSNERLDPHVVQNADAVRRILEKSGKVPLVLQAHYHRGGFSERKGITYYTQPAFFDGDDIRVSELVCKNGHMSVSPKIND